MLAMISPVALMLGETSRSHVGRPSGALAATTSEAHASHERYEVVLTPPVEGGWVGWCVAYADATGSGGGCPVLATPGRPVLDEDWGTSSPPPVTHGLVLTTGEVAAVSVDGGMPIPTRAEAGLPYGLRAVLVEISSDGVPLRGHLLHVVPLDANGQPIPQPEPPPTPIGYELESVFWQRPARPKQGVCQLSTTHLPGLTAQWGHAVPHLRSFTGILGRAFISCVDTEYYMHNWPLDASIDLDATHPGVAPAPLPDFKPVSGHPGVVQAPGWLKLVGRRIRGAWLLVEGGSGPEQRLTVLEHLRATIHK